MPDQPSPRRRVQFRLRTLLIGVAAVAFGAAALRFGWAKETISATVLLLLLSIVLAVYGRPFWMGFAICGVGYFLLTVGPFAQELHSSSITRDFAQLIRRLANPPIVYGNQFDLMCDSLWSLILGVVGGVLAQFTASRSGMRS
jgi:hypothetical protein